MPAGIYKRIIGVNCGFNKGKHFDGTTRLGNKNPYWKGDKVGLAGLHGWIKRRLKKPKLCECCKKVPPMDLANKGTYNRNLENWEWLCRKCHMTKDGRVRMNKGRVFTKKHKKNLSIAHKGQTAWNKGKIGIFKHTEEWKKQASKRMKKEWEDGIIKKYKYSF